MSVLAAQTAHAQSGTKMWGTIQASGYTGGGDNGHLASSMMHVNNGVAAGQVNAAQVGLLYPSTSISVVSVGAQTVVNTTVIGDDNSVDVDANQTATNSGDVDNNAQLRIEDL